MSSTTTVIQQKTINPQDDKKKKKNFCLVIPTYNERENIEKLLDRLETLRSRIVFDLSIVVVDDNSSDGTYEYLKAFAEKTENVRLIERPGLLGIGSAYLDGFAFAITQCNCDYVGEMDADLQHPPEILLEMCEAARAGADVVIASRYIKGGGSTNWSLGRRIVSRSANLIARIFIRCPVADSTSGYRIMNRRAAEGLLSVELSSKGYAFQIESLYVYKKLGMKFAEVPYIFEERRAGKTKLHWQEAARFAFIAMKLGIFGQRQNKS